MPRKRLKKTQADRPVYRPPTRTLPVPEQLEAFADAIEVRGMVEKLGKYGIDVQAVFATIAEQTRQGMIQLRARETLDAWKSQVRPLAASNLPRLPFPQPSAVGRKLRRYQKHREEKLDSVIRDQTRARQLEDGLVVILAPDSRVDEWKRREYTEIVDRTLAGNTAQQIADALGLTLRTVERRLSEVRQAAVKNEEKALASAP